jgi:arsenate reductase
MRYSLSSVLRNQSQLEACLKRKVLFVCENGLYGAMAEALLSRIDSEHFQATSACTSRSQLHPFTVEVLKEIGIDVSSKATRGLADLRDERFDFAITLDEKAAGQRIPNAEVIRWKFDDPVALSSDPDKQLRAFRMVRDQISQRLRLFVIVEVRTQTIPAEVGLKTQPAQFASGSGF